MEVSELLPNKELVALHHRQYCNIRHLLARIHRGGDAAVDPIIYLTTTTVPSMIDTMTSYAQGYVQRPLTQSTRQPTKLEVMGVAIKLKDLEVSRGILSRIFDSMRLSKRCINIIRQMISSVTLLYPNFVLKFVSVYV